MCGGGGGGAGGMGGGDFVSKFYALKVKHMGPFSASGK